MVDVVCLVVDGCVCAVEWLIEEVGCGCVFFASECGCQPESVVPFSVVAQLVSFEVHHVFDACPFE